MRLKRISKTEVSTPKCRNALSHFVFSSYVLSLFFFVVEQKATCFLKGSHIHTHVLVFGLGQVLMGPFVDLIKGP
jgi:hypothetical protein